MMSSSGLQAASQQNVKEIDSVKESISDIINQLQDIDPARLSFSPFLDLDTQISLAPVSDSPESSVEELRSSSHSASGSQRSLEPPPQRADPPTRAASCPQQSEERPADQAEEGVLDQTVSTPLATAPALEDATENCVSVPTPASQGDVPNGTDLPRCSPEESTHLDSAADEGRPLIISPSPPQESVELTVWQPEGRVETCEAESADQSARCCCCRCCCSLCKCCRMGRGPAFCSVLASLLCAAGILYALYFYVPIKPPECPDALSRIIFTLCCCVVAAVPILLAMVVGAVCQFCSGSLDPVQPFPRSRALQQLFVSTSLELLLLYVLNLLVLAALLPQEQLKVVPVLVAMFVLGRLVYWLSLSVCSLWRGFGSGLTVFPLLAAVALNLFLLYHLALKQPLFSTQDTLYNQATPSSWSLEASRSPSGQSYAVPTDVLDAQ